MQYSTEAAERLCSWKEIAIFLGYSVRTLQRWELERGLPVHRAPGGKQGSVYAFKSELLGWITSSDGALKVETCQQNSSDPSEANLPAIEARAFQQTAAPTADEIQLATPAGNSPASPKRGRLRWAALAFEICVASGLLILFVGQGNSNPVAGRTTSRSHIPDPEAVDLYLRGRFFWEKRNPADLERALDLYTQAVVRDPQYAEAYSGMADCYNLMRQYSTMKPEDAYPRAIAAARRAVQLDDSSAEAHNSLAFATYYWQWDWETAEREFRRAIELKPNFATAHRWYANALMSRNRLDEALKEIELAEQSDPSSPTTLADKGYILILSGRTAEGRAIELQLESAQPGNWTIHRYLGESYRRDRNLAAFAKEQLIMAKLSGDPMESTRAHAIARGAKQGSYEAILRSLLAAEKTLPDDGRKGPITMAALYAELGDRDEAMRWLRVAYERHDGAIIALNVMDGMNNLRGDPEFQQMAALKYRPLPSQIANSALVASR
jgi:tetratricopeptide (TPR) repeat protein